MNKGRRTGRDGNRLPSRMAVTGRHWLTRTLAVAVALAWGWGAAYAGGVMTSCTEAALRAAMSGGGRVTFACDGVITLASEVLLFNNSPVTLDATGRQVTISGGGRTRLFSVGQGATLSLIGLTLADGHSVGETAGGTGNGGPGYGGAVWNGFGTLHATNCIFMGNRATGGSGTLGGYATGGAIADSGGTLGKSTILSGCSFVSNRVEGGRGRDLSASEAGHALGGAIYSSASGPAYHSLLLINCSFIGNQASGGLSGTNAFGEPYMGGYGRGGALCVFTETTWMEGATFVGNSAVSGAGQWAFGGAVLANGDGTLSGTRCLFISNRVEAGPGFRNGAQVRGSGWGQGGAMHEVGMSGGFTNCAFVGNTALGGEQFVTPPPTNSLTELYVGDGSGGGAFFTLGPGISFVNATFCGNKAQGGRTTRAYRAGNGLGGAFYWGSGPSTAQVMSVTIASNMAVLSPNASPGSGTAEGGGIYATTSVEVHVRNSLLVHNDGGNGAGPIVDFGFNLSSDFSVAVAPNSVGNTDPLLGPLANNGGFTPTMALLPGSPALDAGHSGGVLTDQRGGARPVSQAGIVTAPGSDGSDIGAVEAGGLVRLTSIARINNTAHLQFTRDTTSASLNYYVQRRAALGNGAWVDLSGPIGETDFLDTTATNPQNYYRVRVAP